VSACTTGDTCGLNGKFNVYHQWYTSMARNVLIVTPAILNSHCIEQRAENAFLASFSDCIHSCGSIPGIYRVARLKKIKCLNWGNKHIDPRTTAAAGRGKYDLRDNKIIATQCTWLKHYFSSNWPRIRNDEKPRRKFAVARCEKAWDTRDRVLKFIRRFTLR